MIGLTLRQILAVFRLELGKTFLARRGLWVYLLAFAPLLLYAGRAAYVPAERARLAEMARKRPVSGLTLWTIRPGLSADEVLGRLGEAPMRRAWTRRAEDGRRVEHMVWAYTDGRATYSFRFRDGVLTEVNRHEPDSIWTASLVFATLFQTYFLRLAVFFGCAGIFMNLFRGEMLDKSLHFYLLTPVRRPVLLAGKYLAGLAATTLIFTASTALQFMAMLWPFDGAAVRSFMAGYGWSHLAAYLGVTALACLGYGSVFLAAGLLVRSPIIPAAAVLLWESANLFVPEALKKISLIFYLQSLCPVVARQDSDLPVAIRLLIAAATPATKTAAIAGILGFTAIVLVLAGWRARRLEINYGTD